MTEIQKIKSWLEESGSKSWDLNLRRMFSAHLVIVLLLLSSLGCGRGGPSPEVERLAEVEPVEPEAPQTLLPSRTIASRDSEGEEDRGFVYRNDWIRAVPWSIHILKIDRHRPDLEFTTALSQDQVLGLAPLTEHLRTIPSERGRPVAAMNGDFYRIERESYAGDPRGLMILRGELVSVPDGTACFWIDRHGSPHIGNAVSQLKVTWPSGETIPCGLNEEREWNEIVLYTSRLGPSTRTSGGREVILERSGETEWLPLRVGQVYTGKVRQVRETGNTRLSNDIMVLSIGPALAARLPKLAPESIIKISTATSPDLTGVETAVGGGPHLVHEGKAQPSYDHKAQQRHPRAAIGWNAKHFFFVVVDGRQGGLSVGMTLSELAAYLVKQGCEEAMNLDGGGSVELWLEGRIVNSPCFGFERDTANSLVLLRTKKPGIEVEGSSILEPSQ